MAVVGYKTDHVMKQTYRHSMADKTKKGNIQETWFIINSFIYKKN